MTGEMRSAPAAASPAFLTARWCNLGLITYEVDQALLRPVLPPGCEPDLLDGRAFASFVMFDFLDTRVRGIRWPGHVNFPEINLRCYVRSGGDRGVCFIREMVPRRLIAWIARAVYNEPYIATRMSSRTTEDAHGIEALHRFWFAGRWHSAAIRGRRPPIRPPSDSVEHFFKEHTWGFGRARSGLLRRYRVHHPVWDIYPDAEVELDVDFAAVYGPSWGGLNRDRPFSVIFAAGSEVSVSPHRDSAT